jgi:hypothetical protein
MKEKTETGQISGITLGIEPGSMDVSFLQYIIDITAMLKTGIRGVYIENEMVLSLARLPATRQVNVASAEAHACSYAEMQEIYRQKEAYYRHLIEEMAAASGVAWSFSSLRGGIAEFIRHRHKNSQVLVMPPGGSHYSPLLAGRVAESIFDVTLLVKDTSEQTERCIELVRRIADVVPGTRLGIMSIDEELSMLISENLSPVHVISSLGNMNIDAREFLSLLSIHRPSLLVMPFLDDSDKDNEKMIAILESISCPAMLVK